ncbi:MAG: hypothetical protein A3B78_01105 [Omnitrophica WOR_2 bacterium RIFCSPHIGHO2_02_FULL_67_20]|nr:MAG: hypothetical protein A3B78_01105 [Omnitrophica WOR_2 bacterium RIFCSPHIGHO2_02_FULL_67_20]
MTHPAGLASTALVAPQLLLIPGLPLAAFTILIFAGRRLGRMSAWVAVAALAGAAGVSWGLSPTIWAGQQLAFSWPWLTAIDPRWALGFAVDGLSWVMLAVVTSIGTLIATYSIGYMRADPRFSRFFAYLSLFCASMLTLVLADNFVLLYAGWELVGLCSYLLISFWFEKPSAAEAGRKAFITTRIGDTGLLLAILLLSLVPGGLQFSRLSGLHHILPGADRTLISLLIFLGAAGKSAQVPLHVWLPDAMEGPAPVSALIHAATMVAAGIYLVARTLPLFTPQSLHVVLTVGLLTHLLAGTIALTQTDVKRVLAYSTISQLGLMTSALGLGSLRGASALAMFHLVTHACFKALLFLAAGSVIHATHEQDLSRLGGLRRAMPWTAALFLLASLAMSGVFPLSGFWSKDAILLEAWHVHEALFWLLLGGAAITAAYIFRLYLRCFEGPAAAHDASHAHESPFIMVAPMAVLGVAAAVIGWLAGSPGTHHPLLHVLGVTERHEGLDIPVLVLSTLAACSGIGLAWVAGFHRRNVLPAPLRPLGHRLYALAANKYYVDEFYARWIVQPFLAAAERLAVFDQRVIDATVDGVGRLGTTIGELKERFDRLVVDRLVNAAAETARGLGMFLRRLQTGIVHQYLLVVVVAVVVLSLALRR